MTPFEKWQAGEGPEPVVVVELPAVYESQSPSVWCRNFGDRAAQQKSAAEEAEAAEEMRAALERALRRPASADVDDEQAGPEAPSTYRFLGGER